MSAKNRRNSILKALRKRRIDRAVHYPFYYRGTTKGEPMDWYRNLHQYSKNKIHCSCPLCSAKVGKYRGRGPSINYKISDVRKIQRLEYEDE